MGYRFILCLLVSSQVIVPNDAFGQNAARVESVLQSVSDAKLTTIHRYLLDIYLKSSKQAEAIQEYEYLLTAKPDDPQLNFEYGRFLVVQDRPTIGIRYLEKAFELAPTNKNYSHTLAAALLRAKQWSRFHELNKIIHFGPRLEYGFLWDNERREDRGNR